MLQKLWWEIGALWWAAWAIGHAIRWRSQGVSQVEIERRVRERMAQVLEARRSVGVD